MEVYQEDKVLDQGDKAENQEHQEDKVENQKKLEDKVEDREDKVEDWEYKVKDWEPNVEDREDKVEDQEYKVENKVLTTYRQGIGCVSHGGDSPQHVALMTQPDTHGGELPVIR